MSCRLLDVERGEGKVEERWGREGRGEQRRRRRHACANGQVDMNGGGRVE